MTPPPRFAPAPPRIRAAERTPEGGGSPDRWRILIADDQPEHLEMIARAISLSPAACAIDLVRATDGIEALAAARQGIDVAFLDIRMPGHTGFEVAEAMKADPRLRDVPVVIVSSSTDPRDVAHANRIGISAYVEKGRFGSFRAEIDVALQTVLNGKSL